MYPSKMGKMGEMEFVKTHLDMQATEGIVSTIPDNMIDTTLYGSRMNDKLFNASKEFLFPLTGPVRYEGGLGETMNRDNLTIELPCKPPKSECPTIVNLWKALEDKQLPSGHLLSGDNCILLLNFVDLVTHACFCEDEKGNVVWYDTFYPDITKKKFDTFLYVNFARLTHYTPTFNPIHGKVLEVQQNNRGTLSMSV
jgi:hypothetical protein